MRVCVFNSCGYCSPLYVYLLCFRVCSTTVRCRWVPSGPAHLLPPVSIGYYYYCVYARRFRTCVRKCESVRCIRRSSAAETWPRCDSCGVTAALLMDPIYGRDTVASSCPRAVRVIDRRARIHRHNIITRHRRNNVPTCIYTMHIIYYHVYKHLEYCRCGFSIVKPVGRGRTHYYTIPSQ